MAIKTGLSLIRERRIEHIREGKTDEYNRQFHPNVLSTCAASYLLWDWDREYAEKAWPLEKNEFKPGGQYNSATSVESRINNLQEAGALIAAELDKLLAEIYS